MNMNEEAELVIDNSAKLTVPMYRALDHNNNPYFIGKLQFPGFIDLTNGASFMLFTSDEGAEELQIGPLDPNKRSARVRQARTAMGADEKLRIDLHAVRDSKGQIYYIGEAMAPAMIPCRNKGIFITAFTSVRDKEELQIGTLQHRARRPTDDPNPSHRFHRDSIDYENHEDSDDNENEQPQGSGYARTA